MRVFKPTVPGRDGKKKVACWYVSVLSPDGRWVPVRGFTDKRMTEDLGRRVESLIARRINREPPDAALAAWLEGLTPYLRNRLADIGALDPLRVAAGKRLTDHLIEFQQAMLAKGCTSRHANLVESRARRAFEGCGFISWSDINASKLQAHLADLRSGRTDAEGKVKPGISAQTSNFYLQACKMFCRWMVRNGRATESPLAYLDGLNVNLDRRHDRRALSVEQLRRLFEVTREQPERYGMTGPDRDLLYRLAVETGLRRGELASLTRSSFDLATTSPTVTVEAAYSKRRRRDVLPLRPQMAAELLAFLATAHPHDPVFHVPGHRLSAALLREDLEAAGIPYVDDRGQFADFHSLRHTFITNLANSGAHPKTVQTLARHSTITLSMDRYAHRLVSDEAAALAALPNFSPQRPKMDAGKLVSQAG